MRNTKHLTIVALTLAAFVGSAKAVDENGELKRQRNNAEKLALIHAPARPKFAATVRDLEAQGQRPLIVNSYRSPASQAAIKARGNSRVSWSYHNAQTPQGKPDALAADFVDSRYFWQRGHDDFWLMLASAAEGHDLSSGVYWGLPPNYRKRIRGLISRREWHTPYRVGWDPGHIEVKGVTLAEARRGKRPYKARG